MDILPVPDDPSIPSNVREYIAEDEDWQSLYPAIYEYLARVRWHGRDREPSRLIIYYEDKQCTIMLTDPHCGKILFHTSQAVDQALIELDARLRDPPVRGWKRDKKWRPAK